VSEQIVRVEFHGVTGSEAELARWLGESLDRLRRRGGDYS